MLVQGETGFGKRDWGLDNTSDRDVVREHATLRVQAFLAARHGLRRVLAPTTDFRAFWEALPADPRKIFARRLREFLDATADVNFSARTITLVLEPNGDGIEFVDKANRERHWIWQEAVIAGPEATAAARVAASAWLKEIEP